MLKLCLNYLALLTVIYMQYFEEIAHERET